jgi:hypothetical protein
MGGVARPPIEVHGIGSEEPPLTGHIMERCQSTRPGIPPSHLRAASSEGVFGVLDVASQCGGRRAMGGVARPPIEVHGIGSEEPPLTGHIMERCQSTRPGIPPSHLRAARLSQPKSMWM